VKKPARIQGLLMVMTGALLVYAVAQRRLRQPLVRQNKAVPNQIQQPTQRPTLRWVFQLLEGIHRVRVTVQGVLCQEGWPLRQQDWPFGLPEPQGGQRKVCQEEEIVWDDRSI
jgi:hypothetical protein